MLKFWLKKCAEYVGIYGKLEGGGLEPETQKGRSVEQGCLTNSPQQNSKLNRTGFNNSCTTPNKLTASSKLEGLSQGGGEHSTELHMTGKPASQVHVWQGSSFSGMYVAPSSI